jgi:hypothetical protein
MIESYHIDLSLDELDWATFLPTVGISKLRHDGKRLHVESPLTLDELDALLFRLDEERLETSSSLIELLYDQICRAQTQLIVSASDKDLYDWVTRVLLHSDWYPVVYRQSEEGTASTLRAFVADHCPEFYLRVRAAVETLALSIDLCLPTLGCEAVRGLILSVAYFDVRAALPRLRAAAESPALQLLDVGNQSAATLAIRVLAGMLDGNYLEYLRGKLNDPVYAAPIYDGLVAYDLDERDRCFWDAAMAAATLPDSHEAAVYTVCDTLLSNPPVDVLPWVKQLIEDLVLRSENGASVLVRPFFESLCERSNLVSLKWRGLTSDHPRLDPYRCLLLFRRPHARGRKWERLALPRQIAADVMDVVPEDVIGCDQGMDAVERSWKHA